MKCLNNQNGIALIVTLLAVAMITAMVVEFAYGVYTGTNNLYNWRDSQRLSVMARSGVNVSARFLSDWLNKQKYTIGFVEMPIENPFEDFNGIITVRIEDENSKFNVNTIINQRGEKDNYGYDSFVRLLGALPLDKKIADRVLDWIDKDSIANLPDSETNAKNLPFVSVDEMLLINGITRKDYDTLMPYVTVFGDGKININGAEKPVLRSLPGISDVLAQTVIDYRKNTPFDGTEKILKVSGFEGPVGQSLMGYITVRGGAFYVSSIAQSGGVKRIIETTFLMSESTSEIEYWKEY
jgi:general secretion pathway protein K